MVKVNIISFQEEAGSDYLNALVVYIIACMTFISIAMLYYGFLLYLLRKTSTESNKKVGPMMDTNDEMFNFERDSVIKWDRKMFVFYGIGFILFNIGYFIYYKILLI